MRVVHKFCTQTKVEGGTWTHFTDGSFCFNSPQVDEFYRQVAFDCGHGDDLGSYNFEHELVHAFLAEKMWDSPSPVLWNAAHNKKGNIIASKYEERWCYWFQRYFNGTANLHEPEWVLWSRELKGRLSAARV